MRRNRLASSAAVARRLAGTLAVVLLGLGCGGYQPPPLGACSEGTPLDEKQCDASGFVAAERCFESAEAACDCLGCPPKRCQEDESAPVQVQCAATED